MSIGLPKHIDYDDLVSWGAMGLLDALAKYAPEKEDKFKNYVSMRIKGSILDELRRNNWVSRSLLQNAKKIEEGFRQLENDLGREATVKEVAEFLGYDYKFVDKVLAQVNYCSIISLDSVIFGSEDNDFKIPLVENVSSSNDTPEESLSKKEKEKTLKEALNTLNDNDRLVLSLYYFEELTMKEISQILNLSESRISQIHSKAILKLKNYFDQNN